ncbi:MAG: general secretion pathway protein D [Bacteriovoracaceae bacterium]|jgi:general secretion pathway protein D
MRIIALFTAVIIPSFFVLTADAGNIKTKCSTLEICAETVSQLTNRQYIFPGNLKGKFLGTEGVEFTAENADSLYSHILNENGYTRILLEDKKTYRIINARDVRYTPVPQVNGDFETKPVLPNTTDYHMMSYQMRHPDVSTEVTRSLRPFMSRYGRIIDNKVNGTLVVQDTAINLKRLYGLIKQMDKEPTREMKRKWKLDKQRYHEIQLEKARNCSDKKS